MLGIGLFFGITNLAHSLSDQSTTIPPSSTSESPRSAANYSVVPPTSSTNTPTSSALSSTVPWISTTPSSTGVLSPQPINPATHSVYFDLNVTSFNISGASSATINVHVANTGPSDAHNVWGKVEVYCQGSIIKLDGQDYLRTDIGTIKAGTNLTTKAILNASLADGLRVLANGGTIKLTIFSDEKTQTYSYDFKF